jgi:hypothetical protein
VAYSAEDVAQFERNLLGARRGAEDISEKATPVRAKSREVPKAGNKTEQEYGGRLEARKRSGDIIEYAFEAVTLKLAFDLRYTPDYFVVAGDGTIEFHEVKGPQVWDDGRDKCKEAAHLFPWFVFFRADRAKDGKWTVREVKTW